MSENLVEKAKAEQNLFPISVYELFVKTREFARDSGDPSYQPIGADSEKVAAMNNNATHFTPRDYKVVVSPDLEPVMVPEGTMVTLYQDPISRTLLKAKVSIGTVFLSNMQITLRGNGKIRCFDPSNQCKVRRHAHASGARSISEDRDSRY